MEKYYEPLTPIGERFGRYSMSDSENPIGVFLTQKYFRDFEAIIKVYELKPIKDRSEIVLLERMNLEKLVKHAKKNKSFVDDYEKPKIERLLMNAF